MATSTIRTMNLSVGMISVPVALKSASERKLPTFSKASPWGNAYAQRSVYAAKPKRPAKTTTAAEPEPELLRVELYDTVTGEVFAEDQLKTGVREGDSFVFVSREDIEAVDALTRVDDIEIDHFLPLDQVPWERVITSYFLAPNKGVGLKALALVRDALEATGKAGAFRLMPKSRVHPAVVYVRNGGLMVSMLAYGAEYAKVYEGAAALADVNGSPEMLSLAVQLVEAMSVDDSARLDEWPDEQADRKVELIEQAREGSPVTVPAKATKAASVADLEQALRQSIEEQQAAARPKRKPRPKAAA